MTDAVLNILIGTWYAIKLVALVVTVPIWGVPWCMYHAGREVRREHDQRRIGK